MLTGNQVVSTLLKYGFVMNSNHILEHPHAPIYVWFEDRTKLIAISWDLEYTIYREPTLERLIALWDLFKED